MPPAARRRRTAAGLLRAFAGRRGWSSPRLGAIGVILVGAAPMAFASVNRNADPIIAQALAGAAGQIERRPRPASR